MIKHVVNQVGDAISTENQVALPPTQPVLHFMIVAIVDKHISGELRLWTLATSWPIATDTTIATIASSDTSTYPASPTISRLSCMHRIPVS